MKTIGAYEAKTHLSELLSKVEKGYDYIITKHGVPLAKLIPVKGRKYNLSTVVEQLKSFRKKHTLGNLKIKDMINEGRKY